MITKTYLTELEYDIKTHRILDAWVWKGEPIPIYAPVVFGDDSSKEAIGTLRPIRWWRRSLHRDVGPPVELVVFCFAVKHFTTASSKTGDYCGSENTVSLEIDHSGVVSAMLVAK